MISSISFLLIALAILLHNIEGERNNLILNLIVGYKISPVISTFSAPTKLRCAAACIQNQACDVYNFMTTSLSNNCDIAVLNSNSFFEEDLEYKCYVPLDAIIPLRNQRRGLWGQWSSYQYCEKGSFVYGVKGWEDNYGGSGLTEDDCGMTGLKLYCKDLAGTVTTPITFNLDYSTSQAMSDSMCPEETFATGFRIKWSGNQGTADDDAMTAFRMLCQTGAAQSYTHTRGAWFNPAMCPPLTLVCGFRVLYVQPPVPDDTCFNEVMMACCFVSMLV